MKRYTYRRTFIFIFLVFSTAIIYQVNAGVEKIRITPPVVYPDSKENRSLIEDIAEKAALLAGRIYAQYIEVSTGKGNADYTLFLNAVFQEDSSVLNVSLKGGRREESFPITGAIRQDTDRYLADVIFFLWSSFHDYLASRMKEPPDYVDELSTEAIKGTVIPEMPTMLMPLSLAVKKDGNLLAAFSLICVEFSSNFRIVGQPGRSLYESGNYTYAGGVAATPGGTIFLKPSIGREFYRLIEGIDRPQKWRAGIDLYGPFLALSDGSVVVIDIQKRKAFRIADRKRKEINLFLGQYSYISALTVGPEGNIWLYDVSEKRIRIHSPEGDLIDTIVPLLDPSRGASPVSLSVFGDGRFLLYLSIGEMCCFNRQGIPLWRLTELPDSDGFEGEPLPQNASIAVDSNTGSIFISDQTGQRIIKFLDTEYCRDHRIKNKFEDEMILLNKKQKGSRDTGPTIRKALLYEEEYAFEMAAMHWERVMDMDPYNKQAGERLDKIEIAILKMNARNLKEKAIELLENVGPETARMQYSKTIQAYEKILSMNPFEEGIAEDMKDLKERFSGREADIVKRKPISVSNISLDNLFPSLMQYYRDNPAGSISVKNILNEEIYNVGVSIFIKRFMDFPQCSKKIKKLKPDENATLELPILFNQSVLDLEEDLDVQAKIELSYLVNDQPQSIVESKVLKVFRRTALMWDDSGKISSFITPNEGIITQFSHKVSGLGDIPYRISKKFVRAIKICDALGVYGIEYTEDPDSPISRILGKDEIVDTVRFPRTTLLIRSGDCDDTTALLAALLESAGIKTAIMTSPGHVFLAFNTEEPVENSWLFNRPELITIPHKGYLWIPVETTVLEDGFMNAWKEASLVYKRYSGSGDIEFLPLEQQRSMYPPIPLPESSFTVIEPPGLEVENTFQSSLTGMEQSLYKEVLEFFLGEIKGLSGKKRLKLKNRIGILHAIFGQDRLAVKTFELCMLEFPESLSAYINLANMHISGKRIEKAKAVLEHAIVRNPDSISVNLLLARCYYQERNPGRAKEFYLKVEKKAPELARRYSYLVEKGSGSAVRATDATDVRPMIWNVDSE